MAHDEDLDDEDEPPAGLFGCCQRCAEPALKGRAGRQDSGSSGRERDVGRADGDEVIEMFELEERRRPIVDLDQESDDEVSASASGPEPFIAP